MEVDSDSECTPPEIIEAAKITSLKLLPEKSKKRYERAYDQLLAWRRENQIKSSFSENVLLAYIDVISKKIKPSTLWTQYSMLRSTIYVNHNVDISKYLKLRALLKRLSDGYKPKKAKILTREEVNEFINRAPDEKFLFAKVALIMGIAGACRKQELVQLTVDDIEDLNKAAIVKIENTKNKIDRKFSISGLFYDIYKKYAKLRPQTNQKRFFLNFQNGKCTQQVVGINKIGSVAKTVATYLKLDNPELYTGHCFRRSSATILVDAGADMTTLKRHGGWKSSTVAEGYIDDSATNRSNIANKIMNAIACSSKENQTNNLLTELPYDSEIQNEYAPKSQIYQPQINHQQITQPQVIQPPKTISNQLPPTIFTSSSIQNTDENVANNFTSSMQTPITFTKCQGNYFTFNFYAASENAATEKK